MNLNQLHYFVTLAHIEHYTRAAEMLSITQPSLSHAISMTYIYDPIRNNWSGDHDRTGCFFVPEYGC